MVYEGYVYSLTVHCIYSLFYGYIGGGCNQPGVIIGFWQLALSIWDGCWFWILEACLALFPESTRVLEGTV